MVQSWLVVTPRSLAASGLVSPSHRMVMLLAFALALLTFSWSSSAFAGWQTMRLCDLPCTPSQTNDRIISKVSMDNRYLVYHLRQDKDFTHQGAYSELYSIPVAGGAAVKLNPPLSNAGGVRLFQVSPDGRRVVFRANLDYSSGTGSNKVDLFSVDTGGGTPVRLNKELPQGGTVPGGPHSCLILLGPDYEIGDGFRISADGTRVVYQAIQDNPAVELYSVPISGGPVTRLNDTLTSGGNIFPNAFQISPDGQRVVYLADQEENNTLNLYSVPITGGPVIRLSSRPVYRYRDDDYRIPDWVYGCFQISADSQRVVFRSDIDSTTTFELDSVPIGGGTPTKLCIATSFLFVVNGYVIYSSNQVVEGRNDLYSIPVGGGEPVQLSGIVTSGGYIDNVQLAAQGEVVVFRATAELGTFWKLYAVPVKGGPAIQLNAATPAAEDQHVYDYVVCPDGRQVIYHACPELYKDNAFYCVSVDGGPYYKLFSDETQSMHIFDLLVSPECSRIAYKWYSFTGSRVDAHVLFSLPLSGGVVEKVYTRPYDYSGQSRIIPLQFSRDGRHLFFATNPPGESWGLYVSSFTNGVTIPWADIP